MINPFPGMNPYLEDPKLWPGVHHTFIAVLRAELNNRLPQNYVADIDERVYVEKPEALRVIAPDVSVSRVRRPAPPEQGAVAVAVADPPIEVDFDLAPVREPFVQVFSLRGGERELVAVIELLSPANKTSGSVGREQYLAKQQELIHSNVHLMEIDLLRGGEHTVVAPVIALERRGAWDYLVSVHKGGWGANHAWVWLVTLQSRLPRVILPLKEGDPDVVIDLQEILNRVYEQGRYGAVIDYSSNPPIPLNEQDNAWLDQVLRG